MRKHARSKGAKNTPNFVRVSAFADLWLEEIMTTENNKTSDEEQIRQLKTELTNALRNKDVDTIWRFSALPRF